MRRIELLSVIRPPPTRYSGGVGKLQSPACWRADSDSRPLPTSAESIISRNGFYGALGARSPLHDLLAYLPGASTKAMHDEAYEKVLEELHDPEATRQKQR